MVRPRVRRGFANPADVGKVARCTIRAIALIVLGADALAISSRPLALTISSLSGYSMASKALRQASISAS